VEQLEGLEAWLNQKEWADCTEIGKVLVRGRAAGAGVSLARGGEAAAAWGVHHLTQCVTCWGLTHLDGTGTLEKKTMFMGCRIFTAREIKTASKWMQLEVQLRCNWSCGRTFYRRRRSSGGSNKNF
jgi:alpha-D-ribose 1-methylphosphonate 5-triphosphate synthase subunit PhnG